MGWVPDLYSPLWADDEVPFWPDLKLNPLNQADVEARGGTCVPTSLAMIATAISGKAVIPERFMEGDLSVNTQSPQDWSDKLQKVGGQLAYCNSDSRNLENYIAELIEYNDLFIIGFYSGIPERDTEAGKSTGGSHMVTMYQDKIYDTNGGTVSDANKYPRTDCMVKRIFRVVRKGHPRKV